MSADIISGASVGIVALLAVIDLWATLGPGPARPARPRASTEVRCPYCHEEIADGTPRVRCIACGTRHHEACWAEHRRCSVFGCGSQAHRSVRPPAAPAPAEPPAPEAPVEAAAPEPVAAGAGADPAG